VLPEADTAPLPHFGGAADLGGHQIEPNSAGQPAMARLQGEILAVPHR
jgi:hypothetical protein